MDRLIAECGRDLEEALSRIESELNRGVVVDRIGRPADEILNAARGARLIIVGARRMGSMEPPLLGSVSKQMLRRAPCPVLVVRRPR